MLETQRPLPIVLSKSAPRRRACALWLVLMLVWLPVTPVEGQVNIEQHRQREDGTSLTLDGAVSIRSGNSDLYDFSVGGQLHHRTGAHAILALARFRYGENDDTQFANASFGHVRHTYWFTAALASEIFGQLERDRFTLLQVRSLIGTGGRMRVMSEAHVEIFYGSTVMLELENLDEARVVNHPSTSEVLRWSNYASFRWMINGRSSLSATVYVQPRVDRFSDVRVLHDAAIEVGITDKVSLRVALRQRFDNRPPDNLEKHDLFVENGLRVRL